MANDGITQCVVYWLFDENCVCPWRHGYVGITDNLQRRMRVHRKRRGCAFQFSALYIGTLDECREIEYRFRPESFIGWNKNPGGGKIGEAMRSKLREVLKGRIISADWREKIASSLRGAVHTEESRQKMSDAGRGRPKPDEWKALMSAKTTARYISQAEREKTAAAVRGTKIHRGAKNPRFGVKVSDETKQKISEAKTGQSRGPNSDETKRKMQEAWKKRRLAKQ